MKGCEAAPSPHTARFTERVCQPHPRGGLGSPLCPGLELEAPLEVKAACPVAVASLHRHSCSEHPPEEVPLKYGWTLEWFNVVTKATLHTSSG